MRRLIPLTASAFLLVATACACYSARAQSRGQAHRQDPRGPIAVPRYRILNGGPGLAIINGHFGGTLTLCYEKFLGDRGQVSLIIPLTGYVSDISGFGRAYQQASMYGIYTGLGFGLHLLGNNHVADIALGAVPVIGYGRSEGSRYSTTYTTHREVFSALLAQLTVTPNPPGRSRQTFYFNIGPVFSGTGPENEAVGGGLWIGLGARFGGGW